MATVQQLIEQGVEKGRRMTLRELLQLKFGDVPEDVLERLDHADAETLDRWVGRILTATTLEEVLG